MKPDLLYENGFEGCQKGNILKALIRAVILTPRLRWSQRKNLALYFFQRREPEVCSSRCKASKAGNIVKFQLKFSQRTLDLSVQFQHI